MAENEILDLGGSRWKCTRAALATPTLSLTAIAECIADDLTRDLRLQLSNAFQEGQTLLTVLGAAGEHPAAMRAAVESFKGQRLARIARDATNATPSKDPAAVALCAANMLLDACTDKALLFAGRNDRFQNRVQREALSTALQQKLDSCRGEIAAVIEASLCGRAVRRQRRTSVRQVRAPIDAQVLVRTPLVIRDRGASHVPGYR